MCVERARVNQRADDDDDGEGEKRRGFLHRFHERQPDSALE